MPDVPLSVDDYVARIVDEAPELTPTQIAVLAVLLRPTSASKPKDRAI